MYDSSLESLFHSSESTNNSHIVTLNIKTENILRTYSFFAEHYFVYFKFGSFFNFFIKFLSSKDKLH